MSQVSAPIGNAALEAYHLFLTGIESAFIYNLGGLCLYMLGASWRAPLPTFWLRVWNGVCVNCEKHSFEEAVLTVL